MAICAAGAICTTLNQTHSGQGAAAVILKGQRECTGVPADAGLTHCKSAGFVTMHAHVDLRSSDSGLKANQGSHADACWGNSSSM